MQYWLIAATRCALIMVVMSTAQAENTEAVDYRKHIMATLGEQVGALSMITQKKAPAENLTLHTEALAAAAQQALTAFETKAEGGESKPQVWSDWPDFSAQMKRLIANLAELDKVAKSGGVAATAARMNGLLSCKGCHDKYLSAAPAAAPTARPPVADAIRYRQHMMKTIDAQSAALGQILSMEIEDGNLPSHLNVLALVTKGSTKAFEPRVPGGESKAEVWNNWPDFSKRMQEMAQKTAIAAKVAKEQGSDAALPGIVETLTCKECHQVYRAK